MVSVNFITKIVALIIITFTVSHLEAATYYVSSSTGNDVNTGISSALPWKSINKINTATLSSGDSVLFKRGDTWRGQLLPKSGDASGDIYYGAYSVGAKPTLLGSVNLNNTSDWISIGTDLWQCNTTFNTDIGNIIFDNSNSVGHKKWNQNELLNQDDFWYNLNTGEVQLFSTSNPATLHTEIELALRKDIVHLANTNFITFENLNIKYGGAHGFGGGNTSFITISSCDMSYIGGGDLNMNAMIRYGNGVEFWGNALNNTVEKCKIWEIYDTGVSNQNHTITAVQKNIRYSNNIIWNCGMSSFEYWNRPQTSTLSDIFFENNTCLYAGGGWGIQRPDYHGIHILTGTNTAQTDSVFIRNNIFYNAQRAIYAIVDNINGYDKLTINHNLIFQPAETDTLFVFFPSLTTYTFGSFTTYTSTTGKDVNSLVGEPHFQDVLNLDFKLTNLSPAINNGVIVDLSEDFDGNARPLFGAYDIGAYEYSLPLSIEQKKNNSTSIYPNPTHEYFRVSFEPKYQLQVNLKVYSTTGRLVIDIENYTSMDKINIKSLSTGTYFIHLTSDIDTITSGKIQVIR